jgi:hypothetical protein
MPAQVIKMQSYRDYQAGLITKEKMLKGETYYPETYYSRDYKQYSVFDIFFMGERGKDKEENNLTPSDSE